MDRSRKGSHLNATVFSKFQAFAQLKHVVDLNRFSSRFHPYSSRPEMEPVFRQGCAIYVFCSLLFSCCYFSQGMPGKMLVIPALITAPKDGLTRFVLLYFSTKTHTQTTNRTRTHSLHTRKSHTHANTTHTRTHTHAHTVDLPFLKFLSLF